MENYYRRQLEVLEHSQTIDVKFNGDDESVCTKWMNVNKQSAKEIIKFLQAQFNLK